MGTVHEKDNVTIEMECIDVRMMLIDKLEGAAYRRLGNDIY